VDSQKTSEELRPAPEIVGQILSYFVRNPRAADTLEGVVRWRLLENEVHRSFKETEIALKWLVEQGFLETVATGQYSQIFRLNATRCADATRFLAEARDH
jgi:hypothetical protein